MRFAKGLETWVKNRLPTPLRDRFNNNKYRYIIRKEKPLDLIIHVGAHFAEDRFFYEELGAKKVLWIEADPSTYEILKTTLANHSQDKTIHQSECALVSSDNNKTYEFQLFNGDGSSSSVYKASKIHKERFKKVKETGDVIKLKSKTLQSIMKKHSINLANVNKSMLVVDVQGHELAVLKGVDGLIQDFNFLKCEVSKVEMYEGGSKFIDIDNFLDSKEFKLSSHSYWRVPEHGDVLYLNKKISSKK